MASTAASLFQQKQVAPVAIASAGDEASMTANPDGTLSFVGVTTQGAEDVGNITGNWQPELDKHERIHAVLTGDVTLLDPASDVEGTREILLVQDVTGSRQLVFGNKHRLHSGSLNTGSGKATLATVYFDGTNYRWLLSPEV